MLLTSFFWSHCIHTGLWAVRTGNHFHFDQSRVQDSSFLNLPIADFGSCLRWSSSWFRWVPAWWSRTSIERARCRNFEFCVGFHLSSSGAVWTRANFSPKVFVGWFSTFQRIMEGRPIDAGSSYWLFISTYSVILLWSQLFLHNSPSAHRWTKQNSALWAPTLSNYFSTSADSISSLAPKKHLLYRYSQNSQPHSSPLKPLWVQSTSAVICLSLSFSVRDFRHRWSSVFISFSDSWS